MNAELVYSILKGVTKFAKVFFDADGLDNPEFFAIATDKIIPKLINNNNDAIISFTELKIKDRDWAKVTTSHFSTLET